MTRKERSKVDSKRGAEAVDEKHEKRRDRKPELKGAGKVADLS